MATGNKRKASNELALFPVNFPAGTIVPFAGATAPEGWALCDGSTVSRSTYASLYLALGDAWGEGDGSTTFHLPDLRGRFLRGVDDPTGVDPAGRDPDAGSRGVSNSGGNSGDAVGSVQDDAIRNITGEIWAKAGTNVGFDGARSGAFEAGTGTSQVAQSVSFSGNTHRFDASNVVPTGSDNRPKNANVNYIIKL